MKIDKSFWHEVDLRIAKAIANIEEKFVRRWAFLIFVTIFAAVLGGIWQNLGVLTESVGETREQVAKIHGALFSEVKEDIFTLDQKKNYQSSLAAPILTPVQN
jgi:hypothetical protein